MTPPTAGFVGLGTMGSALSAHLLAAGWRVTGYDIDPSRLAAHAARGGEAATSPAGTAVGADVVVTSLPTAQALLDVAAGEAGLASVPRQGLVVIETSTLPLAVKRQARDALAERGTVLLDCPLSGTGGQALAKDVVAYLSGPAQAKASARPVLAAMTRAVHDVGDFGNGSAVKFIANLLVAIHNVAAAEALVLAERAGLDLAAVLTAVADGAGSSGHVRGPRPGHGRRRLLGPRRDDHGVRQGPGDHRRVRQGDRHPHPAVRPGVLVLRRGAGPGPRRRRHRLRARGAARAGRGLTAVLTVDVHTHFLPFDVLAAARHGHGFDGMAAEHDAGQEWLVHRQGFRWPVPPVFYDLTARLESMDRRGIDCAVLSVAPQLFMYWADAGEAAGFCRAVNDALAGFAAGSGGRITAVATLPMQDPGAAVAELRRTVTELGMRGAEIGPDVAGTPLDDQGPRTVLAAAASLGVPLILHPYYVGARPWLADFYLTNLIGNPLATTVCAARLIFSGALDELGALRLVLTHGGGYLPYQIGRLDHGHQVRPEAKGCAHPPSAYLDRFWFDTVTHAPGPLRFLADSVGAGPRPVRHRLPVRHGRRPARGTARRHRPAGGRRRADRRPQRRCPVRPGPSRI